MYVAHMTVTEIDKLILTNKHQSYYFLFVFIYYYKLRLYPHYAEGMPGKFVSATLFIRIHTSPVETGIIF